MAPRKRKTDDQPKLEDVVDEPVKVSKSNRGDLAQTKKEAKHEADHDDDGDDLFLRRRARKTGVEEPAKPPSTEAVHKKEEATDTKPSTGSDAGIWVNRAPVVTLWASIVAQRQGYSKDAGLSFGKAIAGLMAQSKGRAIGIYEAHKEDDGQQKQQHEKEEAMGVERVDVFGMKVKALKHGEGGDVRALDAGEKAVDAASVQTYLKRAFGPRLADAEAALQVLAAPVGRGPPTLRQALAESYADPGELGKQAYHLYEKFRPEIPTGQTGWGKKGLLDLKHIKELHNKG